MLQYCLQNEATLLDIQWNLTLAFLVFFFKQKTAYEMRISDWSSDVCSSDLARRGAAAGPGGGFRAGGDDALCVQGAEMRFHIPPICDDPISLVAIDRKSIV